MRVGSRGDCSGTGAGMTTARLDLTRKCLVVEEETTARVGPAREHLLLRGEASSAGSDDGRGRDRAFGVGAGADFGVSLVVQLPVLQIRGGQ